MNVAAQNRPVSHAPLFPFRSSTGKERYLAAYDATPARQTVRPEPLDIATSLGRTHVNVCGPADGSPLVLLPGAAMSSTMWFPNVAALSAAHRLYALDEIGDTGRSIAVRRPRGRNDYVRRLDEAFVALHLDRAAVSGSSHGGWIALAFALAHPEQVRRLVALDPVAQLAPAPIAFYLRALPVLLLRTRGAALAYLRWFFATGHAIPSEVGEQWVLGWRYFRVLQAPPTAFAGDELRRTTVPTLLLLGDQTVIYRERQAAFERARRLLPHAEVEYVPGAGHSLNLEQPDRVNARILRFLGANDETP